MIGTIDAIMDLYPRRSPVSALHVAYLDGLISRQECTAWEPFFFRYERELWVHYGRVFVTGGADGSLPRS